MSEQPTEREQQLNQLIAAQRERMKALEDVFSAQERLEQSLWREVKFWKFAFWLSVATYTTIHFITR